MISSLKPTTQELLNSINQTQLEMSKAQGQVSSGLRVTRASDDPGAVRDILTTRSDLARVTQIDKNLSGVQTETQAADSSIQQALQLLVDAGVAATQGANGTATAGQRAVLAQKIDSILQQMVGIGATQVSGAYIFSGDQTSSPPYAIDPTSATGVKQLVTAPSTRLIQDPTGLSFGVSLTAQQLFDARDSGGNVTTGNVFAALEGLKTALLSNNQGAIQASVTAVNSAQSYLNQQLSFYGNVQNRISTAIDLAKRFETQDQTQLGNEQDADITAAALKITQETTQLNAAMASAGRIPTTSLFNYLPNA